MALAFFVGILAASQVRLDIDAVDICGLTEVMGPGVANERLGTKDGLTIWEDHFYPEIDKRPKG